MNKQYLSIKLVRSINQAKGLRFEVVEDVRSYVLKAKMLGLKTHEIDEIDIVETNTEIKVVSENPLIIRDAYSNMDDYYYSLVGTGGLFSETKFTSIDLRNIQSKNLTNMDCMFTNCKAKEIIIDIDTSEVVSMHRAFESCKLNRLELINFDTSKVRDMRSMFAGCSISRLDISNFNMSKVQTVEAMFYNSKIEKLNLGDFGINKADTRGLFLKFSGEIETTCKNPEILCKLRVRR